MNTNTKMEEEMNRTKMAILERTRPYRKGVTDRTERDRGGESARERRMACSVREKGRV